MKHLKQEFDRLTMKELINFFLAVGCEIAAVVAIFLSLFIEPEGQIHSSVITYFGISCAFCGSLLGISMHYSSELNRFKSEAADAIQRKLDAVGKEAGQ